MRIALLLLTLVACADDPATPELPVLRATFSDPKPTAEVLLDPINMVLDGDTLVVAEAHAWRLLRYPLTSEAGVGAAVELASATPGASVWIPTGPRPGIEEQLFGRILSTDGAGRFVISGVEGDLWTFRAGDTEARRLGAGRGGLRAADGLELGAADLSQVTAAALTGGGLLLVSGDAVYFAGAPDDPRAPLVRVVGSGASGRGVAGQSARRAPLLAGEGSLVAGDDRGNLYLAESGTGRVLLVPDFLSSTAPLLHVAGGGDSLDTTLGPRDQNLEFAPGNSLFVRKPGELIFLSRASPRLLSMDLDVVGDEVDATLEFAAETGVRGAGGLAWARDSLFLSKRDEGTLVRFSPGGADETVVAGPEGGTMAAAAAVPRVGRPGGVVTHEIHGRAAAIIVDDATGKLLSYLPPGLTVGDDRAPAGQPNILVTRVAGANYELFRNLASVPHRGGGALLALGSRYKVQLFQVESGTSATFIGPGSGILPLDRIAMGSYYPAQPPTLVGGTSSLVFFDPSDRVLAEVSAPVSSDSRVEALAGNASSAGLPFRRPSSLSVVDVSGLVDATLTASAGLMVLRTATAGDVVVAFRPGRETGVVAGRELPARSAVVIAGGGAGWPEVGTLAIDVGLAGVSGAALFPRGAVLVRGGDIVVVDVDGAIAGVEPGAVPPGTRVAPGCGEGVYLVATDAVWSFSPETGLSRVHTGPVAAVRCNPDLVVEETQPVVWVQGQELKVVGGQITADGVAVSGITMVALHGRAAADARLADDLPVLASQSDGALLAGVGDCILRWTPSPTGFTRSTPTEVLFEGPPLAEITAIAWQDGSAWVASDGQVFRYEHGEGPPGRAGTVSLVAGGGARLGDGPADEVWFGTITGLLPGPSGQLLIRHDGAVSKLDGDDVYVVLDGVGPSGDHPSIGWDPVSGTVFVPDPRRQEVPRIVGAW